MTHIPKKAHDPKKNHDQNKKESNSWLTKKKK